jgi:hypothetical protein
MIGMPSWHNHLELAEGLREEGRGGSRGAVGSGSGSGSSAIADCVRAPIHASLEQFRTSEYK